MIAEMRNLFFSFQVDVTHLWTAVAAAIVAFSFIFKSAIATMFDSVIFLFVVHAFDVGDGILINGDLHKVKACRNKIWHHGHNANAAFVQTLSHTHGVLSVSVVHLSHGMSNEMLHICCARFASPMAISAAHSAMHLT